MAILQKKTRNYIKGSAKEVEFQNGGSVIHVDMLLSDLQKLPVNEAGYIKITVSRLPALDKYGNSHTLYENDWKPTKSAQAPQVTSMKNSRKPTTTDDLPF